MNWRAVQVGCALYALCAVVTWLLAGPLPGWMNVLIYAMGGLNGALYQIACEARRSQRCAMK